MGESFYAMAPQYIQQRIQENARNAGALGQGESYRNVAISGQPMSVVAGEYDTALQGGPVKAVIMDGGGIDCMSSSCSSCPGTFETLLNKMASNGVQDVIYTRYPEPGNPPGSDTTLKNNLDTLMPKMEQVCAAASGLRCHWVDLRPVWQNGDTNDGLHPTQSGGEHCGDAIWARMVEECIAQ
ncbi:MAG: SGNH/GDSL hydrolase family protein [Polyangiaceae bacterium]|nr:SGNH/GDSL hydrolase family protein [Polyangiaceae bacterium]